VAGVRRFLNRSWRLLPDDDRIDATRVVDEEPDIKLAALLHRTIAGVTADLDGLRFNTAIAKLMEFVNVLTPLERRPRKVLETYVLLLSPFAPHIAEEMWARLGHANTLAYQPWPVADPALAKAGVEQQEYPVQINGKLRTKVMGAPRLCKDDLLAAVGWNIRKLIRFFCALIQTIASRVAPSSLDIANVGWPDEGQADRSAGAGQDEHAGGGLPPVRRGA
jgi:leucyl-tRNA synthetase